MTRQERNRIRKRRTRARGFVLLACLLLFLAGVSITYDVMQEALGMPKEDSILSFGNTGQALRELTGEIHEVSHMIKNTAAEFIARLRLFLEEIWEWILHNHNS